MFQQIPARLSSRAGILFVQTAAFLIVASLLAPAIVSRAQESTVSPSGKYGPIVTPSTNTAAALDSLKQQLDIQQTGSNTLRIGFVQIDSHQKTVRIPCRVNMHSNAVEYVLVYQTGKRHESIFYTEARPDQIHMASLLLGVVPTNFPSGYKQPCPIPASNEVEILVSWQKEGAPFSCPLDQMIVIRPETNGLPAWRLERTPSVTNFPTGKWYYNGSFFGPSAFQAQAEGSIISLIRDPAALVNNPHPDLDNDKIHFPNDALLPPDGTAVDLTFRFPPEK